MGQRAGILLIFIAVFCGTFTVLHKKPVHAGEVFFTPHEIKGQILEYINGCRESIDIAAVDITSTDIVDALSNAQERGVNIRIVLDRKYSLRKGPLSQIWQKFPVRLFIQKGIMRNNFAIFDCRKLITGTYYWTETAEKKTSHCNAIFTDEVKVVVRYQREFDHLFYEGKPLDREKLPQVSEKIDKSAGEKPVEDVSDTGIVHTSLPEKKVITSDYGIVIEETTDGYIDMNFQEFNNIFGVTSDLSYEQKEHLWSKCAGKKVKWQGTVTYIGWGLITGWLMGINHGDTRVEVTLNSENKEHFSGVKYGDTVTYTGRLESLVTRTFPYTLTDGDVLSIEGISTSTKLATDEEHIAYPYVMPVSQGPKRIFVIETFEDIDTLFGKKSTLSEAKKEEAWKKFEGKYVSWVGQVSGKDISHKSIPRIWIKNKTEKDIELRVSPAKKNKFAEIAIGDTIKYIGRLSKRCGTDTPYILEDGSLSIFN